MDLRAVRTLIGVGGTAETLAAVVNRQPYDLCDGVITEFVSTAQPDTRRASALRSAVHRTTESMGPAAPGAKNKRVAR